MTEPAAPIPSPRDGRRRPRIIAITSACGLGLLPLAPGTWASGAPALAAALAFAAGAPVPAVRLALAAVAILFAVTTVAGGAAAEAFYGKRDPGAVVSDEVAGQSLALLAAADPWGVLVGFIAFRLFDIVKPWPIGRLERLPRGWGILADDLAAGLAAGLVVGAARACGLVP